MKKRSAILAALLLLLAATGALAQNNPYAIYDECYHWFSASEQSLDDFESDAFEQAQQKLLEAALRRKDTKAQTLYYVQQLKRTSHLAQRAKMQQKTAWDSTEWNACIEEDRETLQRVAKATGYMQYFHYANELCQTYYFNTSQDLAATEMLVSVMQNARESGDQYAMWMAQVYLGKLYLRISDNYNTRKYFREAVRVYEESEDPTIRRQSITAQLCDLADTYPVASDSARLFYKKAVQAVRTRPDTLKTAYYSAQLAAWDGDLASYRRHRDFCLASPIFTSAVRAGKSLFVCVDHLLEKKPLKTYRASVNALYYRQQYSFVSAFALKQHQWETASAVLSMHVERLYYDICNINNQRLDHMSTQYEQHRLTTELDNLSLQVEAAKKRTAVLVAVIVLEALAFALVYLRIRKRNPKKKPS